MDFIRASRGESTYYIGGFKRYDQQVKTMMSILCFSSLLPAAVLAILVHDDRLAEVYSDIKADISKDIEWVL